MSDCRRFRLASSAGKHSQTPYPSAKPTIRPIAISSIEIDLARLRESESLLANLVAIRHRLFTALDVAEEYGDSAMVCRVIARQGRMSLQSRARATRA
jgi:hypothetical protein